MFTIALQGTYEQSHFIWRENEAQILSNLLSSNSKEGAEWRIKKICPTPEPMPCSYATLTDQDNTAGYTTLVRRLAFVDS